jgi:hypothetical protein
VAIGIAAPELETSWRIAKGQNASWIYGLHTGLKDRIASGSTVKIIGNATYGSQALEDYRFAMWAGVG